MRLTKLYRAAIVCLVFHVGACKPTDSDDDTDSTNKTETEPGSDGDTGTDGDTDTGTNTDTDGDTDTYTDTDRGGDTDTYPERCEEVYSVCADENTVAFCEAVGKEERRFECMDGCNEVTGECNPTVLDNDWFVHQFQLADDSIQTEASYTFENDGLVAIQTANPMASVYVKNKVLSDVIIRGQISVTSTADDDYFGFVFGWQDEEHFYLLDWKQADQNDASCGMAEAGFALKLVSADDPLVACADFWAAVGTDKVSPLSLASDNATGWEDNALYDFELIHRSGDIRITILQGEETVVDITSDDATYTDGMFGFYNYSQESVRYEFFTINPA
jgi:hypothetical protein